MLARKAVLNALYYTGLRTVLAPFVGGQGAILMLHRVSNMELTDFSPNYHLNVDPAFLDVMLDQLSAQYDFVSMDEVAAILAGEQARGRKPFLAITLDDGYLDNIENAVPLFQKYNVPYTIYIAPGMTTGKSTIWWEDVEHCVRLMANLNIDLPTGLRHYDTSSTRKKRGCYNDLMETLFLEIEETKSREVVTNLSAMAGHDDIAHLKNSIADFSALKAISKDPLCTIGAHSMGHFVLSKLDPDTMKWELAESKRVLEKELGTSVEHFAYPYGYPQAAGLREFKMAKSLGFKTAVTTRHGVIYEENANHIHALPRVSVNGHHQSMKYMSTLLSGIPTRLKNFGRKLNVA